MKLKITVMVMLGIFCLFPNYLSSQCVPQRASVNSLSAADQCELRNLMLDYLNSNIDNSQTGIQKYPIVDMHTNPPVGSFSDFHNYEEEFATWHRNYLQGMEEYILAQGFPQYVPLPYWTPHNTIPDAFYNYAGCGGTYANLPQADGFPLYLNGQGPYAPTGTIDFTMFHQNFDCIDWNNIDDFIGYIEGNPPGTNIFNRNHNGVHGAVGGTLGPPGTAPASTLFWLFHAYITDLHSCYLRQCDGEEAEMYIRDNAPDDGSEPTIQNSALHTSPDIWVRNEPDGFGITTTEKLCYKINDDDEIKPVYVYVRTWNKGLVPSKNNENDLEVYWAKPSAGLSWPAPWDGVPFANSCGLPLGGFISSQSLRSVNGQYLDVNDVDMDGNSTEIIEGYTIYEFQWFPPDPDEYEACFGPQGWDKGHFCIHARMDDGDSWNLSGGFYSNLANNNDLALKNIYIYGEDDQNQACEDIIWLTPPGGGCIFFGNYTQEVMSNVGLELRFPTITDQVLIENTEINLTLKDGAFKKWSKGKQIGEGINYVEGTESVKFTEANGFIGGMTLQPMEVYRFCLDVVGDPAQIDGLGLELDIIQTVGGEEVGGERFHIKKVTPLKESKKLISNTSEEISTTFKVYPNPATDRITVSLDNYQDDYEILISNSVGQTMKKHTNVNGNKEVDVSDFGRGIFFVRITNQTTGEVGIQKIFLQ